MTPDWLHGFLKLGDPDLASAVFPAYAENKAVLVVCIGSWEALSDVRCIDRVDHVDVDGDWGGIYISRALFPPIPVDLILMPTS
ncbi:unnamed protein product [Penicillium camemberti]|uniref:Str. FM013 n=1 Tax=Penicillium camemberti (strain FM 013) TaxID=1429867 RepID=A0A0G4NWZ5_PENC3|nr:unnamed protein product [Penicillium camemberti]